MKQLLGHKALVSYANSKQLPRTVPRGIVNDEPPTAPPGLSPAQAYRWLIGRRHLTTAEHTDINDLDDAARTRHFARLRATIDDLLHLCDELSKERAEQPPDGPSNVF